MRRKVSDLATATILVSALSLLGSPAEARVTRIEITSREVVAEGMSFGDTGPYEKLRGSVFFEVDPSNSRNAVVFDLDKAPRNKSGKVEFSGDMMILKPVDLKRGNGGLFLEVNNRGNVLALNILNDGPSNDNNPSTAGDFGNGWLLRQGYVLAWVGWEADISPGMNRLTVQLPIALEDGRPIVERILTEFADVPGAGTAPVFTQQLPYESVSTDLTTAKAELRKRPSDSRRLGAPEIPDGELVRRDRWSFADCPNGPPGSASTTSICLADGFRNDLVYDLRYRATRSPVMALGYVTTRDFISFLRNETQDDVANPNPVFGVTTVLCQGISQTGQYVRDFLYQGFNEDEQGRRVCDGAHIHVQGLPKLALNYRFAQPNPPTFQHRGRYKPDNNFPRSYAMGQNPLDPGGERDGILKRPDSDPKIIHTVSATEYWQFRASLLDTDENGTVDLIQPDNVRRYLCSSTQHFPVKGAPSGRGVGGRQCQQDSNTVHNGVLIRALFQALDEWVRKGTEPPASRVPRIADSTLIPPRHYCLEFPRIPGVNCNSLYNGSGERDFGPRVNANRGVIDYLNPTVLSVHRVLVPAVDELGNEIAGIRHPFVEAPKATLTGWNLRTTEFSEGDLCDTLGMEIPLPRTVEERLATGDPRSSLEELYGDHWGYVRAVAAAAVNLYAQRLMLLEDVLQIIQEADESNVLQ